MTCSYTLLFDTRVTYLFAFAGPLITSKVRLKESSDVAGGGGNQRVFCVDTTKEGPQRRHSLQSHPPQGMYVRLDFMIKFCTQVFYF